MHHKHYHPCQSWEFMKVAAKTLGKKLSHVFMLIKYLQDFFLKAKRYKQKTWPCEKFISIDLLKDKIHLPASMFEAMLIRFSLTWPVQALVKALSQHCMPAIISIISVIAPISFSE